MRHCVSEGREGDDTVEGVADDAEDLVAMEVKDAGLQGGVVRFGDPDALIADVLPFQSIELEERACVQRSRGAGRNAGRCFEETAHQRVSRAGESAERDLRLELLAIEEPEFVVEHPLHILQKGFILRLQHCQNFVQV